MTCKELKEKINNKSYQVSFLVLIDSSHFIGSQYIKQIANNNNLTIIYVDSLSQVPQETNNVFNIQDNNLYVIKTNKITQEDIKSTNYNNTIILSDSADDFICAQSYVVIIPKLEEWQIKNYMEEKCKGLNNTEIDWIFDITKGNIHRIDKELDKISIFRKEEQDKVFNDFVNDDGYCDLNPLTIYNFTNAFIKKDYTTMSSILTDLEFIDIEGTGLITILRKNIHNLIDIQINPKNTPESLGMKPNQFNAIKYNKGKFTDIQLINMYDFLTSIDYELKSGRLDLSNNRLVDYIVCKLLS